MIRPDGEALARDLAERLAAHPQVAAVALAGSTTGGGGDEHSDIDLYVYLTAPLDAGARAKLAADRGTTGRVEIDNRFFEPGDEWADASSGVGVDIMYRDPAWIEDRLEAVLDRHEAGLGYTTCFWFNVRTSTPLFDRDGWFARLQRRASAPYPDALARAIVAKNLPMLRDNRCSYLEQMRLADARRDAIGLNHRSAAFLASYFDLLFALNRRPHPGEKRLLRHGVAEGMRYPEGMAAGIDALLAGIATPGDGRALEAAGALAAEMAALVDSVSV